MLHRLGARCVKIAEFWVEYQSLGSFKKLFQERFFPREMTEAKVEEFINLKQGSMTVKEYSLKLVKLSRYVTFFSI